MVYVLFSIYTFFIKTFFLNFFYEENKKELYDALFSLTQGLIQDYPGYQNWFYGTFIEGLKKHERIYLVAQEGNQIVGCTFLKNTPDEKKISSLYVVPTSRKKGIGHLLMEKSVKLLGTGTIVSVSDQNLSGLSFLLKKWEKMPAVWQKPFWD